MNDVLLNPSPIDIKKHNRSFCYDWDELKGFLTKDNLIVWYRDVHHQDMLSVLGMGTGLEGRYDIVIYFKKNVVRVTTWWGKKTFTGEDENIIKNDKNLCRILKNFEVEFVDE